MNLNKQRVGVRNKTEEVRIMDEFKVLVKIEKYLKLSTKKDKKEELEEQMIGWVEREIEIKIKKILEIWKDVKTNTLKSLFDYCHEEELNEYKKEIEKAFEKRNPKNAEKILSMIKY